MKLAVKASRYSYQDAKTTQLLRQSVSAVTDCELCGLQRKTDAGV